jgi:hypothetical protein
MFIEIDASSLVDLSDAWQRSPEIVIEELTAATFEAQMLLERETKELTPVGVGAAGGLRGNIQSDVPQVLGETVIGMVGTNLNYAEAVELGTKPHPVSAAGVASIEDWVRYKLGISAEEAVRVAEAVAWKIRMFGTPGYGMFHRALAYNEAQLAGIFEAAGQRIGERLTGAT